MPMLILLLVMAEERKGREGGRVDGVENRDGGAEKKEGGGAAPTFQMRTIIKLIA